MNSREHRKLESERDPESVAIENRSHRCVYIPWWREVVGSLFENNGAVAVPEAVQSIECVARRRVPCSAASFRQSALQLSNHPLLSENNGLSLRQAGLDLLLLATEPRLEQEQLRGQRPELLSLLPRQPGHQVLLEPSVLDKRTRQFVRLNINARTHLGTRCPANRHVAFASLGSTIEQHRTR